MEQYISKSALVAEIKKKKIPFKKDIDDGVYPTYLCALMDFEDFIDTLEVKEVDLNKEISNYLGDDWRKDADGKIENEMIAFAKHFFELGMQVSNKAQKGE